MKQRSCLCPAVLAMALGLGGCGSIEHRPPSPMPEPPPWNSIELIMIDTEIVRFDDPGAKALSVSALSYERSAAPEG